MYTDIMLPTINPREAAANPYMEGHIMEIPNPPMIILCFDFRDTK